MEGEVKEVKEVVPVTDGVPVTEDTGGGGVAVGVQPGSKLSMLEKHRRQHEEKNAAALERGIWEGVPLQKSADHTRLPVAATFVSPANVESDPWKFGEVKSVMLRGGPLDQGCYSTAITDEHGLIYFFRNDGMGRIEQAVYRVILQEEERTDEERRAGKIQQWEWVGEYIGKRLMPKPMVNGIRKGS